MCNVFYQKKGKNDYRAEFDQFNSYCTTEAYCANKSVLFPLPIFRWENEFSAVAGVERRGTRAQSEPSRPRPIPRAVNSSTRL